MDTQLLLSKQYQWPLIARDIVLLVKDGNTCNYGLPEIAKSYDIPLDDFTDLLRLDAFKAVVQNEMERYKALGPNAGYKMRTEALIIDLQERLYSRARDDLLDDKNMLQFLGMLMKSAGLDSVSEKEKEAPASVNIAFNLPKLENGKLAHLVGQSQNNVIDI